MGRKRQEGVTTLPRYKMKAYAVGYGISFGNERLANDYAEALAQARSAGYGLYKNAYQEIKAVLREDKVPSALWGLYKAFANELINKVQRRKSATIDEIVAKWVEMGLDENILRDVVSVLVEIIEKEVPRPAERAA